MNDDHFHEMQQRRNDELHATGKLSFKERVSNVINGSSDSRKERRKQERKLEKLNKKAA